MLVSGHVKRFCRPAAAGVSCALAAIALLATDSQAQFLRLGPFDFRTLLELDAVYSSNVEGQRPSESDLDQKDYYLRYGLRMPGIAEVSPRTTVNAEFGVNYENHFVRDDLDNASEPFLTGSLSARTELRRLTLNANASYDRSTDQPEEVRISEGVPAKTGPVISSTRKKRKVGTDTSYGIGADWKRDPVDFKYDYQLTQQRYVDELFKDGDNDTMSQSFLGTYQFREIWTIAGSRDMEKDDQLSDPNDYTDWVTTDRVELRGRVDIERPNIVFFGGMEKEDQQEIKGTWDAIYGVTLSDSQELTPYMTANYAISYEYDQNPEQNDIALTYSGQLVNQISRTASQALGASRQPAETFGSTADTDSTDFTYTFTKSDLFIYDLNMAFQVGYAMQKSLGGDAPEERTWDYSFSLNHRREISRRLSRTISYAFTREDSNLEEESLDEHRVTLGFVYEF